MDNQSQLLETVASTLSAAGMHDKAGEFYEEMNQLQRAMDRYFGCLQRMRSSTLLLSLKLTTNAVDKSSSSPPHLTTSTLI